MNIRFYKRSDADTLRGSITHKGVQYKFPTHIKTDNWNAKLQKSADAKVTREIKILRVKLEESLDWSSTEKDIQQAIKGLYAAKKTAKTGVAGKYKTFSDYFYDYCKGKGHKQAMLGHTVLERVWGTVLWADLNDSFYLKLIKKMEKAEMRPNYQGDIIKRLKAALNEALAYGYTDYTGFQRWKKPSEETFAIALTEEDIEKIWNAKLEGRKAQARDLFILGVYTAARYSDYSKLSMDNIADGKISFSQKKTGGMVLIPCAKRVTDVLERNGGNAPCMHDVVFNRTIKEVCREVGLDEIIQAPESTRKKMGKEPGEKIYKWEMVSSHTARRTGATMLYKSGLPIRVCRYLTGHTTDDTFLKYVKIDREEASDILAKSDFFTQKKPHPEGEA